MGIGVLAGVFHLADIRFPSLKWFFSWREMAGWVMCSLVILAGASMVWFAPGNYRFSPETERQIQRFRSIRRGYFSLVLLALLVLFAMMDNLLVGNRALVVKYEGKVYFPVFRDAYSASTFGGEGDGEVNYRELKKQFSGEGKGNWVLMPPVPWAPALDSDEEQSVVVEERKDGLYYMEGKRKPYSGIASTYYLETNGEKQQHTEWRFRNGEKDGSMTVWSKGGEVVQVGQWKKGELITPGVKNGQALAGAEGEAVSPMTVVLYPPLPPSFRDKHFMGTDTGGNDILAQLFGGWQILLQANVVYLVITYAIGISLGCAMGFFGGRFDMIVQRLIEILSNMPFLYVVIIIASVIKRPPMPVLVGVLCIFSWIGMTYYLRTATYREKARDYVAAARLMGAGTGRIIFRHVLPNTIAIVVTLLPFSVTGLIGSLMALDYLGFGLPVEYPSWGRLLAEGSENLSAPWIVSGGFFGTVIILVLVTFVGEAVREAFDPKKFTTYK
jgi:microcin C transport system permease protein